MNTYSPLQAKLERLLDLYQVQGVGTGYRDLILAPQRAVQLLHEFSVLPVAVERITWWCHCTPTSQQQLGCPHGLGGPLNLFGKGWFSECVGYADFCVRTGTSEYADPISSSATRIGLVNKRAQTYLEDELHKEPFYHPCLHAGLWLTVPEHWQRVETQCCINNSVS